MTVKSLVLPVLVLAIAGVASPAWCAGSTPGRSKKAKHEAPAPAPAAGTADSDEKSRLNPEGASIDAPAAPIATTAAPGISGTLEIGETTFDAGEIDHGKDITHVFVLKNVGKGSLTVSAKPGCGCTVVDYDKEIAPGASGKLTANVHTSGFKGSVTKSITLTTSDPEHAVTDIKIKAHINLPIEVDPSDLVTFNGRPGKIEPIEVKIASVDGVPFDVISARSNDPNYTASLRPLGDALSQPKDGTIASGGHEYMVRVTPAADAPIGHATAEIRLKTSHPRAAEVMIRVQSTVHGDIEAMPERLTIRIGGDKPASSHSRIRTTGDAPFAITSVETNLPELKTLVTPIMEGRYYDLEVVYEGPTPTAVVKGKVTVHTDNAKQPTIEIEAMGFPESMIPLGMKPGGAMPVIAPPSR